MQKMLSKSKFIGGWQCEKQAYLTANHPKLATPFDSATLARFAGGRCIEGFKKIAGECIECLYFNWAVLVQSLLLNFGMALFLLHQSMKPVVSRVELPLIWNKVESCYPLRSARFIRSIH